MTLGRPDVTLGLPGVTLGRPRLHLRVVDSTNARARELAAAGAPHGMLVTATEQTAGRGRQGRSWLAPAGSALLCSLVLREVPRLLPLAAGVAVAELAGAAAQVKWPNDVLVEGRKLAGILVEGRPQEGWAVLGIGVNVALDPATLPSELRGQVATLGRPPAAVEQVLTALLGGLERWTTASETAVLEAVRTRDALRGHPVRWTGGAGEAAGIDGDGRLLVRIEAGVVALEAGEVHLLR
ncbi:MAG TPA: biotin--[acetyl-CoA-carboxylase] ligase [Solirubrobacteraceae bacterium]|nr:biotin--[acetyl-CoA-carboxylase] ligase [Solirubrobacteraceae bacterium]